jgi:three-Cys-motif partner protein
MGAVGNFFSKKRKWSIIKDHILDWYLTPYIVKILATHKPLVLMDCFAGKGRFEDGGDGSPLILAKKIKSVLSEGRHTQIEGIFIEKKYAADLRNNLHGYSNCKVIDGTFEDNFENVLSKKRNSNVFIYIDPYGIKSLDFNRLEKLKQSCFNTYEMLMNFNTFGFLREGCRLLKCQPMEDNLDYNAEDEVVYENEELDNIHGLKLLNEIADGDYWQDIIQCYQQEKYDMFKAEELFINEYIKRLKDKKVFKYTVNIPVKIKTRNIPKYRLIFGSNHPCGLFLMCDNMNKQWKKILEESRNNQMPLFEIEFPERDNINIDLSAIIRSLLENKEQVDLKELCCALIEKNSIAFSTGEYSKALKDMEKLGQIIVFRNPSTTPTGRPAIALNPNSDDYKIEVVLTS